MLTKSKIATLAVLASLGLLMAAPAEAKSHVNVGVGIGAGVSVHVCCIDQRPKLTIPDGLF